MNKSSNVFKNISVSVFIIILCSALCTIMHILFYDNDLIPAIYVLGVFIISVVTEGYIYGICSALMCVLMVNYAFTVPLLRLNFTIPENIISAVILLFVAIVTSGLTVKIKYQEAIKAESEKERMRANLLRAVSHDLRTPLTTIYGSSSALLENYNAFDDEQFIKILHGIKEDSEWLTRMVENLLSVTRLDGDNVKIIKIPTVLEELIDSVLVKFAKRYPQVTVSVNIPEELVIIPMDPLLIEQVVINILDNAVVHAVGMKTLSLKVSAANNRAVFEITDDGCGIPEDKLKNIFQHTFPLNNTPADGRNNAGIGLSVCASIIKAHSGNISAENKKDGGCTFSFTLDMGE